ncbi:hypothetical protein EGW08_007057 [Elysia chlorotica]|uniref:Reticulocalbin-3 n=1 Tax=Elysia chlorotica TaxID=188477 RepID=A0A433TUA9_ELYCH|nr:hypothetical protein EGW08_007057 [Elysia chlorotica]
MMRSVFHLGLMAALACCLVITLAVPEAHEAHRHAAHKTNHKFSDGSHNPVFDQEALLGSHKMDDLADLPDDVRINRLRNLAKSHDANNNDIIEVEELKAWIMESFRMLDKEEAMEKLEEEDGNSDGKVTFEELLDKQYGYTMEDVANLQAGEHGPDEEGVHDLIKEDEARFIAADLDKDGSLDDKEYMAFFQPYDYPHMHDIEMSKTMKDFDKDNDGFVSRDEFTGDVYDEESRLASVTNFEELDKDKDNKLTSAELKPYALPDNDEVAKEEAEHLLNICDEDKDGQLSIEEIVTKEDEFVSSAATDYGRTLHFVKDEL